jgi:ketopantoate reductase
MREVIAGAEANGVKFRKPGEEIIRGLIDATATMGAYRSSMQVDRQEARPLEAEAILGEPCRRAEAKGVKVPWLRALYEMVRVVGGEL